MTCTGPRWFPRASQHAGVRVSKLLTSFCAIVARCQRKLSIHSKARLTRHDVRICEVLHCAHMLVQQRNHAPVAHCGARRPAHTHTHTHTHTPSSLSRTLTHTSLCHGAPASTGTTPLRRRQRGARLQTENRRAHAEAAQAHARHPAWQPRMLARARWTGWWHGKTRSIRRTHTFIHEEHTRTCRTSINTRTYIDAHNTNIHTCIRNSLYTKITHICARARAHTHTHTLKHTRTHTHTQTHTCMCMYIRTHAQTHIRAHTHTHAQTMHMHGHARVHRYHTDSTYAFTSHTNTHACKRTIIHSHELDRARMHSAHMCTHTHTHTCVCTSTCTRARPFYIYTCMRIRSSMHAHTRTHTRTTTRTITCIHMHHAHTQYTVHTEHTRVHALACEHAQARGSSHVHACKTYVR